MPLPPRSHRTAPALLLVTCLAGPLAGCPTFPEPPAGDDDDACAPAIDGLDGDGSATPIADVGEATAGLTDAVHATHRFASGWHVHGAHLDTLTEASLDPAGGGERLALTIEPGGTSMQRTLLLPAALHAGAFVLTVANPCGQARAETFVLQGEPGEPGEPGDAGADGVHCWDTNGDGVDDDEEDVNGDGVFDVLDCHPASDPCPPGYDRDGSSEAGGALCIDPDTGDEVVQLGDGWIDRFELSLWGGADCSGGPYGLLDGDAETVGFDATGNWTVPLYACSIEGVQPAGWLTWFQAQQACALAGKTLCADARWQAAAAGTPDDSRCNIDGGSAQPGGEDEDCESVWGAFDMVGNLWEWTALWGVHPGWNGSENLMTPAYGADGYWAGGPAAATMPTRESDGTWRAHSPAFDGNGIALGDPYGPSAARRGGHHSAGTAAGVFATNLSYGPSSTGPDFGARCCLQR